MQRRYECKSCKKSTSGLELIRSTDIPEYARVSYPIRWAGETCFCDDLATMILNDTLTAKTMEEIGTSVSNARFTEFTRIRLFFISSPVRVPIHTLNTHG